MNGTLAAPGFSGILSKKKTCSITTAPMGTGGEISTLANHLMEKRIKLYRTINVKAPSPSNMGSKGLCSADVSTYISVMVLYFRVIVRTPPTVGPSTEATPKVAPKKP